MYRCVENVIRATETLARLEARLATAEKERDDARQRLTELQQSRAPASGDDTDNTEPTGRYIMLRSVS